MARRDAPGFVVAVKVSRYLTHIKRLREKLESDPVVQNVYEAIRLSAEEIQRLVGRSLRGCVNLELFKGKTLTVDTDVLVADGGTRCAAILAGYAALHNAADGLVFRGEVDEWPLLHEVAAVSVGVVDGETRVDLDYAEDVSAHVDLNVVATAGGEILEVQGGSEAQPLPAERYVTLVAMGVTATQKLIDLVRPQLT